MFIEKNILLDEIVKLNEFILTYQSTKDVTKFIEILDYLRSNTNQNTDIELFNNLISIIDNIYTDTEASYSMIYHKRDKNILNEILYGLYNSKLKIANLLDKLRDVTSLVDVIHEMNL